MAASEQDGHDQVGRRPDRQDRVDEELRAREADATEVVQDQQHKQEDPAEDLRNALGESSPICVQELLDSRHPRPAEKHGRDRAKPFPSHEWQHFNIGLTRGDPASGGAWHELATRACGTRVELPNELACNAQVAPYNPVVFHDG